MSRIYYRGKFYDYPLVPLNALRNLGPVEAVALRRLSYVWVRVRPPKDQTTLEGFVAARFGWRLYQHFFKTYTEKVWGVPGHRDPGRLGRAAHQGPVAVRRGVGAAPAQAIGSRDKSKQVTSLIEEFNYPKYGPGHDVGALPRARRGRTARKVDHSTRGRRRSSTTTAGPTAVTAETPTAPPRAYECTDVISSMPIGALLRAMDPPVPADGASRPRTTLRYRDFITVALVVPEEYALPRQLDLHPRPRASRSAASRTSGRGRRTW